MCLQRKCIRGKRLKLSEHCVVYNILYTKRISWQYAPVLENFSSQVQQALDKLNLSAYKRAFARNQISGELLMLCSEEVLEKELGVTSKLHRMKIMALVQGRSTVWKYLDGTYQGPQLWPCIHTPNHHLSVFDLVCSTAAVEKNSLV